VIGQGHSWKAKQLTINPWLSSDSDWVIQWPLLTPLIGQSSHLIISDGEISDLFAWFQLFHALLNVCRSGLDFIYSVCSLEVEVVPILLVHPIIIVTIACIAMLF